MTALDIKILNVIPDERLGGPQLRVIQVADGLRQRGFVTSVALPKGDDYFFNMLMESGMTCYQSRSFRRLPDITSPLAVTAWLIFFFPAVFWLMRLIRKHEVDIIHANGFMSLQAPLAAKLSRRKLVWHLNDTLTPRWVKLIMRPFFHLLPDAIATASEAVGRYYGVERQGKRKATVIYPPIDTARFSTDSRRVDEYRREFSIPYGSKLVGIIGNINPEKGYEYFIDAAGITNRQMPDARFIAVGKRLETREGYWRLLQRRIGELGLSECVIFAGYRSDIANIINMMDVLVLPSLSEGAPVVILEAMACGKPVVATRVGGVPELVVEGETGLIVPARNAEAIAEAVLALLNDPAKAERMGLRGRERAVERFDLEICVAKHEELYESIMRCETSS